MTQTASKRMGRPPKTSREEILDAAAGFDPVGLQLTTLAQALGISVKTVYYYFPTRRALLDALTERAVTELGLPDVADAPDWRAVMRACALWAYRLGASQPGWFSGSAAARGVGVEALRRTYVRLIELGWSERDAVRAHSVMCNWALAAGEAAHVTRLSGGMGIDNIHRHLADYADPETIDDLTRMMSAFDIDEMFEDGLKIILAGLEATLLKASA
jgi:TetR/AcrR family tetracycline transcriptional repressor